MFLSAHLTTSTAEHGRLAFHPDCPRCRAERLTGSLGADSLVSRRTQAALAAGLVAFSAGGTPALAQIPEADPQQEAPPSPGGEPPGLQPEFDPGGEDTFDYDTAPVPGGPEAGGQEDEGFGPPVETEPTTDPDADELAEEEAPPPPALSAPSERTPAPAPAQPPAPAPPVPPPPAPAPQQPVPTPVAEVEQPAPQPESRETSTRRKAREHAPKAHEVERRPVIANSPTPPPERPAPVVQSPAPVVQSAAAPAPPATVPISQPSVPAGTPITGSTYTVRSGDSLWSIARRILGPDASAGRIAREVNRLWELNQDRIGTGKPSLIYAGTVLRLP